MRISELSAACGVPVPTIKYYLRERLLPPGRATAATQAQYGDEHVARLRLIRALVDVGRLSLTAVRDVLAVVDLGDAATPAAVGAAHDALPPQVPDADTEPRRALAAVDLLGWHVDPGSSSLRQLEVALEAVEAVGMPADEARLRTYGQAALEVAAADVAEVPRAGAGDAVQYVVVGTVLYE
ncbi:MAG TPA: MerR family transcriptional regulator, partial [Kineosporiaceae bacterium]|nr:MerR family transcriptional regulator [Kineosporiaceae bacterium]